MIWNILSYSQELESILKKNNMKISYSNTTKSYYLMNICQNCQAKQGEFIEIFSTNCSDINALIWFNAEHKTNLTYNINY